MLKYTIALLSLATTASTAVQTPAKSAIETIPASLMRAGGANSYMVISPADRAKDFQQAFEMMRKEKSNGKVFFQLFDGSIISNVIDMSLLPNSTLFVFRFNSPQQGIQFQVVKVEDIATISYQP